MSVFILAVVVNYNTDWTETNTCTLLLFWWQLLNTAESSIGDVDGLHAKLDRKRSVESHNQQAQATFQQRFEQSLLSLTQGVNDFSDCYHTVSDTATSQLGKGEFGCLVPGKESQSS
jgi:hypothetical protein